MQIKYFSENEISQVFNLAKLCAVPDFYIILDENKKFYEKVASNGLSVAAVEDDKLVGFLLYRKNTSSLSGFIDSCETIKELHNSDRWDCGIELMNSCVHPDHRGMHLEQKLISIAIENSLSFDKNAWFWATTHKDNTPSRKAVMANRFQLVLEDIEMPYRHIALHRNLYIRGN